MVGLRDIHKLNGIRKKLSKSCSRAEFINAWLDYQRVKPEDMEAAKSNLIKELDNLGIGEVMDKTSMAKMAIPFMKR